MGLQSRAAPPASPLPPVSPGIPNFKTPIVSLKRPSLV